MKTHLLKMTTWVVAVALMMTACKNNDDLPKPPDETETNALKLRKASASEIDYQLFDYDSSGRITRHVSQWQYVQSDPSQIKRIENNFEYNSAGQLITVRSQGSDHRYFYTNGTLERVESRASNRLISTTYFLFDAKGRVSEREEVVPDDRQMSDAPAKTKWKYTYDAKGNCVHVDYFLFMEGKYSLYETLDYSEFDSASNPFDQLSFFPYVPWVKFQVNNPGKQISTAASTGLKQSTTFRYQYDAKGIPTQRTINQGGAEWTLKLEY
ncbi:hypothetical protein [Runella salmonicolor]|uniref:DUF4595 domain-containing protein n=1 Tax=Runella salmonicolor TaxID=2950278 RepID=A0ABT1FIV3_9BACT|nr:hypothetical protein [Runella salmonicolor]MCP1381671.1 hypothetical protein [Runella salmonicolor]